MSRPESALVLGGGCAGIAAAVKLAESGVRVTLLETRKRLGGRATSHLDPSTRELIDNAQHVVLGCCTNLIDLYARLDVADQITWHRTLHFADKTGKRWDFAEDPLPAPTHLTRALVGYRGISLGDRWRTARIMSKMMRARRGDYESITFAEFLAGVRASSHAIDRFWDPIVRGACNLRVDQVSASSAMQVFQQGFMAERTAWRMGVSKVPLARLYDRVDSIVAGAGGVVRLGCAVAEIAADGVTTSRGETLRADVVISALPHDRLAKAATAELVERDPRLRTLDHIGVSPIIGIHLWLDRPILQQSHLFFADGEIDWVFDQARSDDGQHLHAGISAAHASVPMKTEAILAMAMKELAAYESAMPGAGEAKLVRGQVIREKRATIAPVPGLEAHRPATITPGSPLLLAGDWTATGWPSTMEGAVRSGYAAAHAALGGDNPRDGVVADLPIAPLCRLLGMRR